MKSLYSIEGSSYTIMIRMLFNLHYDSLKKIFVSLFSSSIKPEIMIRSQSIMKQAKLLVCELYFFLALFALVPFFRDFFTVNIK